MNFKHELIDHLSSSSIRQGKAPKVTFEDDRKVGTHVYEQPYVESVGSDESEEFAADSKTE